MKQKVRFFLIVLGFTAGPASAAEVSAWQLPARISYGYGSDQSASMQGVFEAEPAIELKFSPTARLVLSGRVRLDTEDRLEPGRPNRDTYSPVSRPLTLGDAGTAEVRDAYLEIEIENGIVRLGKQQIVWGRLDGLKVLDTLNPQNFREFIMDDFDHSRIGLWSAYVDRSFGDWRTEFAWIPDASGHEIPEDGAWFQLTAPRFRYGATTAQTTPPVSTDHDAHGIADGAVAGRLSHQFGVVDMSAVVYSGLDFEPLGTLRAIDGEPLLERFYERRTLYGVNAETSFGPFALRAELSWQPRRKFNSRGPAALNVIALDQRNIAIAADIDGPFDTFINVQYVVDRISNAPSTLVRPDQDRIITTFLRRSFVYETVQFEFRWYRSLEDDDELFSISLGYDVGDNTRLRLAAENFSGIDSGLFGQFAESDRLILGVEHTF